MVDFYKITNEDIASQIAILRERENQPVAFSAVLRGLKSRFGKLEKRELRYLINTGILLGYFNKDEIIYDK